MKSQKTMIAIFSVLLLSVFGVSAANAAPIGKTFGASCQAESANPNVKSAIYGIENRDTSKAVKVTCPMLLTGNHSGTKSGGLMKVTVTMADMDGSNSCRAVVRNEDGTHYYKFASRTNQARGSVVNFAVVDEDIDLNPIVGKYLVMECTLHRYSGSGTPATIRAITVQ